MQNHIYYYAYYYIYITKLILMIHHQADISKINVKFFMLYYTNYTILTHIKNALLIFVISFDL